MRLWAGLPDVRGAGSQGSPTAHPEPTSGGRGASEGLALSSPDYGDERIQVMTLANLWDAGTPRDQRADPCLATASPACPAAPLKSWAGQPGHLSCTCCWATRSPPPGHPAIVTTGK